MHRDGKWAKQIISQQDDEGKWGCFHSLSQLYDSRMTTEQALRRLEILGFTIEDPSIQKAVSYMTDCLGGRKTIPDRREKVTDWDVFCDLMLATWIRRFTKDCGPANQIAEQWSKVVTAAFVHGSYDEAFYEAAYRDVLKPKHGRINGFAMFYPVSLLYGCLDEKTERAMIQYLMQRESGIYYIYDRKLSDLPDCFTSREASRYLGAVELLSGYSTARYYLGFVVDWLLTHRNMRGKWDMGSSVKDKVYFPLSDDWRRRDIREADCTQRIEKMLSKLR